MDEFLAALFVAWVAAMALLVGVLVGGENPSEHQRHEVVCEYQGGTAHDGVCVKDGRVLDL